ncbi:MAG: threonine synthase [Fusobacteria bacterium]|nr:threonine synthase [Fusobacteriota bacterium]
MKYISTRGNIHKVNSAEAIRLGMVPNGGLFVPENFPIINDEKLKKLINMNYQELAKEILSLYLTDFSEKDIENCISLAYNSFNFSSKEISPLVKLTDNVYIMELWHGPTAAFKDMALQIMPHLLVKSKEITKVSKETVILVATSGDTGKAALEGFKNVDGIKIIVFYPKEGVSEIQKLQMNTTDGNNTYVVSVEGNFDDCQTGVKEIFADIEYRKSIEKDSKEFSSANSINWGRLLPQIVYYFKSYTNLVRDNVIKYGDKINFSVPTGNFGNILAGYYAKKMGLPINKLICASNDNNVLTDFFLTGEYNKNRDFYKTISPSMDILISSNLERFLFDITGNNGETVDKWYVELQKNGSFKVDEDTLNKMNDIIYVSYATEDDTKKEIKKVKNSYNYISDTHTAVAIKAVDDLNNKLYGVTVVASTASPYKFSESVIESILDKKIEDEFAAIDEIAKIGNCDIHRAVKNLKEKEILHKETIKISEMKDIIKKIVINK